MTNKVVAELPRFHIMSFHDKYEQNVRNYGKLQQNVATRVHLKNNNKK